MARTVLVVVPGRLFRDGLRSMLRSSGLTVIGACESFAEAADLLDTHGVPDLIVVGSLGDDILCELAGIEELSERMPGTRRVLLCKELTAESIRQAIDAGIDGFLLQDVSAEILHHIIELMLLGHPFVPQEFARSLAMQETSSDAQSPTWDMQPTSVLPPIPAQGGDTELQPSALFDGPARVDRHRLAVIAPRQDIGRAQPVHLSDRETEILQWLVNGASNKAIARDLKIAEATVKVHVKGLLRKMQLQNRTQAAIWALNNTIAVKRRTHDVEATLEAVQLPTV